VTAEQQRITITDPRVMRALLVCAGGGQAAICVALAYADGTALIIALVALLACGLAVTQPTIAALLPEMVRRDDLPRATALNQTAGSIGVLVGPALAGLLVGEFGTKVPLLIDAASYLALAVAGLLLRTIRNGGNTPKAAAVVWRLRRDPMVLAVTAAFAATVAGVGAVGVVEIFFVRETLGGSTTAFGLIQATWTAGMLAGAWLLTRPAKRAADDGALVNGLVLMLGLCCAAVLAGAAVPAVGWLVPLWLAGGVLNGGLGVFLAMIMARRVPAEARGRAFAVQGAAIQGAAMFGYLGGGLLLEVFAPRPLVAVCGLAGLVVIAVVAIPVARAVRGERKATRAAWTTSAASA